MTKDRNRRLCGYRFILRLLLLIQLLSVQGKGIAQKLTSQSQSDTITAMLSKLVNENHCPGIVAAIASSDGVRAIGAAGVRKYGSRPEFSVHDQVHLGSCAKAMTAVLLATLVEEGRLSWETPLSSVIPGLESVMHRDYQRITLWNLLTHRSGLPSDPEDWEAFAKKPIDQQRLALTLKQMAKPAVHERGAFHYSNFGYVVAGCVAEQLTGETWETLIQRRVFDALGMASAGFGPPGRAGKIDQPWGHTKYGKAWKPSQTDYHETLRPAGGVHCNLSDWAKFAALQLKGEPAILDRTILNRLIEPIGFYAAGWGVAEQEWAKGLTFNHAGSNERWYALVYVAPALDRIYMVAANAHDFSGLRDAVNEMLNDLIKRDLRDQNSQR